MNETIRLPEACLRKAYDFMSEHRAIARERDGAKLPKTVCGIELSTAYVLQYRQIYTVPGEAGVNRETHEKKRKF